MRLLGRLFVSVIVTACLVVLALLFILGRTRQVCPGEGGRENTGWQSPHIPLYSSQCPEYYKCPLPPGKGMQSRPDGTDVEVVINSECYRGPLAAIGPGTPSLLFLGDSFTFGFRVGEGEAYPALVGQSLSERLGCPVEIVNLAVPGFSLRDKLFTLREKGLSYKPDVVVLQLFWGGLDDNTEGQTYIPPVTWLANALRRAGCARCDWLASRVTRFNVRFFLMTHSEHSAKRQEAMGEMWREFLALSEQENFTLIMLDLGAGSLLETIPQDVNASLMRYFIHYFPGWEVPENLIPDDGHPNPAGHRIIAEKVADTLLEFDVLKCGGVR